MTTPTHDPHPLAAFKPRAAVDWVKLRISTLWPTQHRHLRAKLPPEWRTFAEAQGQNENSCSEWLLTIQDPPPAPIIARILRSHGVDPNAARVEGIEIAIDWYPRTPESRAALAQAAHHLLRHLARPPADAPRITEPKHYRAAARPRDSEQALRDGWTVNIGERDTADHCMRFYVKRHDRTQAGAYDPLPETQHRARMEVTLQGKMLPATTLQELATLSFQKLARHFHQREATAPTSSLAGLLRPEVQQWGRPDDAAKRTGHRRQSSLATVADSWANTRIYDALRGLTRAHMNAGISEFSAPPHPPATEGASHHEGISPKYIRAVESNHPATSATTITRAVGDLTPPIQTGIQAEALDGVFFPSGAPTYKHFGRQSGFSPEEK